MKMLKLKTKSLTSYHDLSYNQSLGLPVEVYSLKHCRTIAFGKIRLSSETYVCINDRLFSRTQHLFFGCPRTLHKPTDEVICDTD
jgi:hypothetical protein